MDFFTAWVFSMLTAATSMPLGLSSALLAGPRAIGALPSTPETQTCGALVTRPLM